MPDPAATNAKLFFRLSGTEEGPSTETMYDPPILNYVLVPRHRTSGPEKSPKSFRRCSAAMASSVNAGGRLGARWSRIRLFRHIVQDLRCAAVKHLECARVSPVETKIATPWTAPNGLAIVDERRMPGDGEKVKWLVCASLVKSARKVASATGER